MKIIMATNVCRDLYYSKTLIQDLVADGMDVTVFANPDDTVPLMEKICRFKPVSFFPRSTKPISEYRLFRTFKALFKAEKPDYVLLFNAKPVIYGGLAAKALGIPVLVNMTGLGKVYMKKSLLQNLMSFLYKRTLFDKNTFTFFANPDDRALFLEKRIVGEGNSCVVPGTGVDLGFYRRAQTLSEEDFRGTIRFVYAGRILRSKGVLEFLEAARMLRARHQETVEFAVLGAIETPSSPDPDYISADTLQAYIEEGSIVYEGYVKDMRAYLETKASCVVLPSYYREGLPRILLQAIAMGCGVIAADTPGTREPVEDGVNGFLCRVKDSQDLANQMEKYLGLSVDAKLKMSQNARRVAETRFDEGVISAIHLQKLRERGGLDW